VSGLSNIKIIISTGNQSSDHRCILWSKRIWN